MTVSALGRARILANLARSRARQRLDRRSVGPVDPSRFESLLDAHATGEDAVFVHAGLRDVGRAFGGDPYRFLLDRLGERFESVLVPGFTTSFKRSGLYHRAFSRPEFGTFAELFLDDADHRTDDAIHSILVAGPYRFPDCDHHDSFGEDGCWAKLDRENVLYLNVGTDRLKATQLHYLEERHDVPYVDPTTFSGTIYYDEHRHGPVTQRNHADVVARAFNRRKLATVLERRGVLDSHDLNGLRVRFFRSGALRRALGPEMARDPYYLVA